MRLATTQQTQQARRKPMAELSSRDRLQPSLLDRLIDLHPQDSRENVEARVLSRQQLRAAVLRDLSWLFNATRAEPEAASGRIEEVRLWRQFADARRSVLNFGMPAFSGTTLSSMETATMEVAIKLAITQPLDIVCKFVTYCAT